MKIFIATVEAILQRTFPAKSTSQKTRKSQFVFGSASKNLAVAELRTMVHSLFLESSAMVELSSQLLFIVLTVCVSHEAQIHVEKKHSYFGPEPEPESESSTQKRTNKQGPVAVFDSYVLAAICAIACELQLFPLISRASNRSNLKHGEKPSHEVKSMNGNGIEIGIGNGFQSSIDSTVSHTRHILAILEALFL